MTDDSTEQLAPSSLLATAENAMLRHDWQAALNELESIGRDRLPGNGLALLGEASWWLGRLDESIDAYERAYRMLMEEGKPEPAALVCISISENHFHKLQGSVARGWLRTAERLLADLPKVRARGYLTRFQGMLALEAEGDLDKAMELAEAARAMGARHNDHDLEMLALHDVGRIKVAQGAVSSGLELLEEAMVAAVSGELGAVVTGKIYCNMVETCGRLADYRRASEWDDAARRWCDRLGHVTGFPGICRVKRAELRLFRGDLDDAEAEARRACEELGGYLDFVGLAHAELGEIHRRRGDLTGAAEAFQRATEFGHDPQPGLALLKADQGDLRGALHLLEAALEAVELPLLRARLLPAFVDVSLRLGDIAGAEAGAAELADIANGFGSSALRAAAAGAAGLVAYSRGDHDAAVAALRESWRSWSEADCPYEAARARAALGRVYAEAGRSDRAEIELQAARVALRRLGVDGGLAEQTAGLRRPAATDAQRALMFTDMVRSTDLVRAIGDQAWTHLVAWHDTTLRSCFAGQGGVEHEHPGDGFFISFEDPERAVKCAVEIQRTLNRHRRDHGFAPEVRIGLHYSEVVLVPEGLAGIGVHTAARIASLAMGGEVVASRALVDALVTPLPGTNPRSVDLKGVGQPTDVVTLEWS